jgi:hypothetical protein
VKKLCGWSENRDSPWPKLLDFWGLPTFRSSIATPTPQNPLSRLGIDESHALLRLTAENAALRYQLIVLRRIRLTNGDRLAWTLALGLSRSSLSRPGGQYDWFDTKAYGTPAMWRV